MREMSGKAPEKDTGGRGRWPGAGRGGKGCSGVGTAGERVRCSAVCLGTRRRLVWREHSVGRVGRHTPRPADAPEQTWREIKLVVLPFPFEFF